MKKTSAQNIRHYDFLNNRNKYGLKPIYFIYGAEYYLREKVLSQLLKKYNSETDSDFDTIVLYGDSNTGSDALDHLEMAPFISKYKIVIMRNFHNLKTEDKNILAEYAKQPASSSILILVADKIDKRKKAEKTILASALSIECKKPYSSLDINNWLKNILKNKNITMNADAINLFCNSIELDFMLASNELEKLLLYTKDSKNISKEAVSACMSSNKTNKIFDLQNSLGNRNLKKSLEISENMLENRESSVYFIIMLTRYFIILWKIQTLRKQGLSDSEIANSHLNEVFYSFRTDYLKQSRNFSVSKLREIFRLLLLADIDLKSISIKENIILELLIYKICK